MNESSSLVTWMNQKRKKADLLFLVLFALTAIDLSISDRIFANDDLETIRKIAQVSRFPFASPRSSLYDPGLVGWTPGVEYDSATAAAVVYARRSSKILQSSEK